MRSLSLAVVLAACGSPETTVDAPATTVGCTAPGLGDSFDGPMPCLPWGTATATNATLTQQGGHVSIATTTGLRSTGDCRRLDVPFTAAGTITEASTVLTNVTGKTSLQVRGGGDLYSITVAGQGTIVGAVDREPPGPTVPYDPILMRWWRIRPGDGGGVVFETAPDGVTWTELHATAIAAPTTVEVTIGAGVIDIEPEPGLATFESVDLCPP